MEGRHAPGPADGNQRIQYIPPSNDGIANSMGALETPFESTSTATATVPYKVQFVVCLSALAAAVRLMANPSQSSCATRKTCSWLRWLVALLSIPALWTVNKICKLAKCASRLSLSTPFARLRTLFESSLVPATFSP